MGIFSQDKTTTNQTALNGQVGISNRDQTGSQVTGALGANTGGLVAVGPGSNSTLTINSTSLDAKALDTAAFTINHALDIQSSNSQASLQGFQNALTIVGEHQQSATQLATGQQQADSSSLLGKIGLSPGQAVAAVAVVAIGIYLLTRAR